MKLPIFPFLIKIVTGLGILLGIVLSILLLGGIGISAYILSQWNDSPTAEINQNWIVQFTKLPDEENRYLLDLELKEAFIRYTASLEHTPEWQKKKNTLSSYSNAAEHIMGLFTHSQWEEDYDKFLLLSKEEKETITDLIVKITPQIRQFTTHIQQAKQDPERYQSLTTRIDPLSQTKTPFITRLYSFIILQNIRQQEWKEAGQHIEFLFSLSNIPTIHPSIYSTEFLSLKQRTHSLLQIYLQRAPTLSQDEIKKWANILDISQENTAEYTRNLLKEEYTRTIQSMQDTSILPTIDNPWIKTIAPFYMQKNHTISIITQNLPSEEYLHQSCLERKKNTEQMNQLFAQIATEPDTLESTLKSIFTRNKLGKEYAQSTLYEVIASPLGTQCYLETNTNLTKTMLLLKHYKQTHGEYPTSLEAMESNTLFPLPSDYFSFANTPFRYDSSKLTLSSVKGGIRYGIKELIIELEPQQ